MKTKKFKSLAIIFILLGFALSCSDDKETVSIATVEPMEILDTLLNILKERKVKNLKTKIEREGDIIHIYYDP
jgi:hypothetical protein